MALCVCKCLNVTLDCEKCDDYVDVGKLELTAAEQRDIFFSEKLFACPAGKIKSHIVQTALLNQRNLGRWTLHSCLSCQVTTHAVLHDHNNIVLISKALITTQDKVNALKKSSNFSPVFNLLVPETSNELDMKENIDTNNLVVSENKTWMPTHQVTGDLSKQLNKVLESQLESIEETVRQFREQKYAEYEAFRERAHKDHKILASVISKAQSSLDNDGYKIDASIDNGPPSPQLPPTQKRRLSSLKDTKKIQQHFAKPSRPIPAEEDSLDTEDMFVIEGTDSNHHMTSDQDYDDSDDSCSSPGRPASPLSPLSSSLARSLPINMPNFPADRPSPARLDDHDEPADIAASMKAIARSLHGDVFELPRPRCTTQI